MTPAAADQTWRSSQGDGDHINNLLSRTEFMDTGIGYDKCLSFINCQITPAKAAKGEGTAPTRFSALTLSRESGSAPGLPSGELGPHPPDKA